MQKHFDFIAFLLKTAKPMLIATSMLQAGPV